MVCVILVYIFVKQKEINHLKQKTMTTFQKTLNVYKQGQKHLAYLSFLNDSSSIKTVSFEKFCLEMDKILLNK